MNKKVVRSLDGIKPCMGLTFNRDDIKEGYIVRKNPVKAKEKIKVPWLFNIHMEEILAGMYPGIGASATENRDLHFKDLTEIIFQDFLHA